MSHPHGEVDGGKEYKVKNILKEKNGYYLIDWEDDEVTGERYAPTWEPKRNANKEAVADWKRQLAAAATPKRRGPPRKVVDSSPEILSKLVRSTGSLSCPRPALTQNPQEDEVKQTEDEPENIESRQTIVGRDISESPLFEPLVEPSEPPSSFAAGECHRFSSTQPQESSAALESTSSSATLGKQSRSVPANFEESSSRVIPDSQTAIESLSSAPAATAKELPAQISLELSAAPKPSDRRHIWEVSSQEDELPGSALSTHSDGRRLSNSSDLGQTPKPGGQSSLSGVKGLSKHHFSATKLPTNPFQPTNGNKTLDSQQPSSIAAASAPPAVTSELQTVLDSDVSAGGTLTAAPEGPSDQSLRGESPWVITVPLLSQDTANLCETGDSRAQVDWGEDNAARSIEAPSHLASESDTSFPFETQISPVTSGSIGSLPNHSISAVGESVHKRLSTAASGMSELMQILTEKLKGSRNKHLSRRQTSSLSQSSMASPLKLVSSLAVSEQDRRSPSAVPAVEPAPTITQEEMNTSERYETLLPQAHVNGTVDEQPNGILTREPSRRTDTRGSRSHIVPIVLVGHQRDQYQNSVYYHNALMERFLSSSQPDHRISEEAEAFVDRMRRILLHPDLDNPETLTQYVGEPGAQAQWDIDCSAKFRFLKTLLDSIRNLTIQVVVVTKAGRVQQILAKFLNDLGFPHRKDGDEASSNITEGRFGPGITLISVDKALSLSQGPPADIIVVFDPAVSEESVAIKCQRQSEAAPPICLTLIVPDTIEHIERSLSTDLTPCAKLRALVHGMYQLRNGARKLDDEHMNPDQTAHSIAKYLAAQDREAEWPIPTLGMLANLDSQTDSDLEMGNHTEQTVADADAQIGTKRSFNASDVTLEEQENIKRARIGEPNDSDTLDLLGTINPQDIEITHISDSGSRPTKSASGDAVKPSASSDSGMTVAEQHLQHMLKYTQDRLHDHVHALSDLQCRHEAQREELIEITNERDSAIRTAQQAVTRMTEAANVDSKLKLERSALKQQLEAANARLLDHSVPERAEFEALRLAAMTSTSEKEQLERRLESAKEDLEYLRTNYQSASQSAQNLAIQNTELESELAVMKHKASGEQSRLRQMGYDAYTKNLQVENKKMKVLLRDREAGLRFRDEELAKLREAARGRMGTRGTSVPRSPRLGSPMKVDGARGSGRGSRQGSPAASDLRGKSGNLHPLRNG